MILSGATATDPVTAPDDMGKEFVDENAGGDDFADIDAYDAAMDEESQAVDEGDEAVPMEGISLGVGDQGGT